MCICVRTREAYWALSLEICHRHLSPPVQSMWHDPSLSERGFLISYSPHRPVEPKRKEPVNVTEKPPSYRGLLGKRAGRVRDAACSHAAYIASLDEQAFRRLPEVGAAPDMIDDDLPTNPDYLDEHFGAAAGLREFSDDEFDETVPDSPSVVSGTDRSQGATSAYGGETITMLRAEGIHTVENYFETLPPDPGEAARLVVSMKMKDTLQTDSYH